MHVHYIGAHAYYYYYVAESSGSCVHVSLLVLYILLFLPPFCNYFVIVNERNTLAHITKYSIYMFRGFLLHHHNYGLLLVFFFLLSTVTATV